ncbi:hypothetical protein [Coxiella-like endosymbiont of Rhipicephalus sanguineus]|uniref:hypothetical protein n=1 Tax=Coxiella-like endosymbiont of Rhipicephalus sanguineus TaxID=1955402 RepID=UPI0020426B52|nr:hypothetical protein [Coxiella-like endosymbiont of Rhipicephalus sanguineus]
MIDELAGLIHPTIELIGMAFDWSVIRPSQIDDHRYQRGNSGILTFRWRLKLNNFSF